MDISANDSDFAQSDFSTTAHGGFRKIVGVSAGIATGLFLSPGLLLKLQKAVPKANESALVDHISAIPQAPSPSTLLTSIKESFCFNITELASIFEVTRPTVYNWIKGQTSPKTQDLARMQVLASVGQHWRNQTTDKESGFLIDYSGPRADEPTIREAIIDKNPTRIDLNDLISERVRQYRKEAEISRAIIGEQLPDPKSAPPESSRRMNEMWTKTADMQHAAQNGRS